MSVEKGKEEKLELKKSGFVGGTRWLRLESMGIVPQNLDSKFYSYNRSLLLDGELVLSHYNNTGTFVVSSCKLH